ncbi:MAG: M48 family metalloprotease [Zoogloeaceae bacterium]|nr:M48 family metalloprotease [Zoogloeaceae bacterium]
MTWRDTLFYTFPDVKTLLWALLAIVGGIVFGSLAKAARLAGNGAFTVARELGGQRITRPGKNPLERRLLNVLDEMSIAAGVIPPLAFVLPEETGINALAIGQDTSRSAIVVTRGALERLSREELQALIAHEISHIVNGDARLNLRLIALLHGIQIIPASHRLVSLNLQKGYMNEEIKSSPPGKEIEAAYEQHLHLLRENIASYIPAFAALFYISMHILLFFNDRVYVDADMFGKVAGLIMSPLLIWFMLPALTMPLYLIGTCGVFFCQLARAGISRARETLADAAAVQYTRNPEALAGVLRKIEQFGSEIHHPDAQAASHMFFGASDSAALFATHPPIEERLEQTRQLRRAFPVEAIPRRPLPADEIAAEDTKIQTRATPAQSTQEGTSATSPLDYAQSVLAVLPEKTSLATPAGAMAAVYALLLSSSPQIRATQLRLLKEHSVDIQSQREILETRVDERQRLPLLDMALPTLRDLPLAERQNFLTRIDALVKADGRVSTTEFALGCLLKHVLLPRKSAFAALQLKRLNADVALLLSLIVRAGNRDETAITAAFQHAAALAPIDVSLHFPEKSALSPKAIEAALDHLAHATPRFREKLLTACVAAVEHDGKITVAESELVRAFAQSLDCPAPSVLPD